MNKTLLLFLSTILLVACSAKESKQEVEVQQLQKILTQQSIQLLDVRTPQETANGIIKTAQIADFKQGEVVEKATAIFKKDSPLYVYCYSGGRSSKAAEQLTAAGFTKVYNVIGGIKAWQAAGFPLQPTGKMKPIDPAEVTAFKKSLEGEKIQAVNFYATWCATCKKNKPLLNEIAPAYQNITLRNIDIDQANSIYQYLKLQAVPVLIIYKNGQEINRLNGALSAEAIKEAFAAAA